MIFSIAFKLVLNLHFPLVCYPNVQGKLSPIVLQWQHFNKKTNFLISTSVFWTRVLRLIPKFSFSTFSLCFVAHLKFLRFPWNCVFCCYLSIQHFVDSFKFYNTVSIFLSCKKFNLVRICTFSTDYFLSPWNFALF